MKMGITWALAAFFWFSALVVLVKSKWNVGSLLLWLAALLCTAYGLFMPQIDAFTATGIGFLIKLLFWLGVAVLLGIVIFLALAGAKNTAMGDEKALIVLGAGLRRRTVSDLLRRRLIAAQKAYAQNPAALLVVSGGQGRGEDIPEAEAMRQWLLANGMPPRSILAEDKSTSTETNLLYSKVLLTKAGVSIDQPIALVTNRFHCYRARCYAKRAGFTQVRSIPASMNWPTFLQNYLREAAALVYMWLPGRHPASASQTPEKPADETNG